MDKVPRIKTIAPSPYPLTDIYNDTHDTKTFRFGLPADATLDMLPGDHLYIHATINGKAVKRPYTPSSLPGTAGFFDLTVKRYETGVISIYLHDQRVGDNVLMSVLARAAIGSMAWRRRWDSSLAVPALRR